ncbi:protease inhibitor I42 family protein [Shewanella psychropiezotolerans]|uniref:Protease inhibitor I42 family protein n=2 Tax=Shewanellaceae TaxID=267890 RepID=A0ABX5WVE4_9GAMM|nr:protease inhibitor I42 family protein [Shewanella sp. YLB-07]QDO83054.1 protease inhibitor I42 family protein [Shewanella psychropiezotolerans]
MNKDIYMLAPITVKIGEPIVITLEDNPSTGFNVCLTELPSCIALISDDYIHGSNPLGMVGVPGTRRFTFIATKAGEGALKFNKIKFTHPELTILDANPMENRFVSVEG